MMEITLRPDPAAEPHTGHTLMRYRPDEVTVAIVAVAAPAVTLNR
jgi:hypothetical protein